MGIRGWIAKVAGAAGRYDGMYNWAERLVAAVSWLGASTMIGWFASAYDAVAAEGWGAVALFALFGGPIVLVILMGLLVAGVATWRWLAGHSQASVDGSARKTDNTGPLPSGAPSEATPPERDQWGGITLSLPGFVVESLPQESGVHILKARLEAKKRARVLRMVALFRRGSQSNMFELVTFTEPKYIAASEPYDFYVLCFTPGAGSIWGSREVYPLDDITGGMAAAEARNRLSRSSRLSCRIVVSAEGEDDLIHEFTVYTGDDNTIPQIIDPAWHLPYGDADHDAATRSIKRFL